jgi:tRNA(adenine34) deaminase
MDAPITLTANDEHWMRHALREAELAFAADEVPIGAVIVAQDRIIARGHNLTERLNDVTAHAEMQAITAAAEFLGGKYLHDCTLYVTVEPCVMCAGALAWGHIGRILLHPRTQVTGGVLEPACADLMKAFFRKKRSLRG